MAHSDSTPLHPAPVAGPHEIATSTPSPTADTHEVIVRRSPRYLRFMALGAALGVAVALVLTFAFPETLQYSRAQVFGFVGIILVAVFLAIGASVAIVIDRVTSRRARAVTMTTSEQHAEAD